LEFLNNWLWLISVLVGLMLAVVELFIGVEAGLDLVIIGSAAVIGGLVTWPFKSWVLTVIVVCAISSAYVVFGRKYVHHRMQVKETRTNIDTIVGQSGIVLKAITKNVDGLVRVGYEEWKARAEEEIGEDAEVTVTGVTGVTLTVKKENGGA
jgi:membrane protein implicated in regulation of membrane protease activity